MSRKFEELSAVVTTFVNFVGRYWSSWYSLRSEKYADSVIRFGSSLKTYLEQDGQCL